MSYLSIKFKSISQTTYLTYRALSPKKNKTTLKSDRQRIFLVFEVYNRKIKRSITTKFGRVVLMGHI
jgi:hypothetical protein